MVGLALRGLEIADPKKAVGFNEAVLFARGRPKLGSEKGSDTTLKLGRGRAYILARLDRDGFAELAAKVARFTAEIVTMETRGTNLVTSAPTRS